MRRPQRPGAATTTTLTVTVTVTVTLTLTLTLTLRRNDQAPLRVCFDIENTLVTGPRVAGDYSSCEPIAENIATCRALYEQGHTIILQSSRGMDAHKGNASAAAAEVAAATLASLAKLQIPYHEIDFGTPHA